MKTITKTIRSRDGRTATYTFHIRNRFEQWAYSNLAETLCDLAVLGVIAFFVWFVLHGGF